MEHFPDWLNNFLQWVYCNRGELATWFGIAGGIIAVVEVFFQPIRRFRRYLRHMFASKPVVTPVFRSPVEPINPLFALPIRPNPWFTGREEVFEELAASLETQYTALTGMGGVGKSHTAIHFAYRNKEKYEAVFWVVADTQDNLINNFAQLVTKLTKESIVKQDQQLAFVQQWLETHSLWLLILDNVESEVAWRGVLTDAMQGQVLLTARAKALDADIKSVHLAKLSKEESCLSLLRQVYQESEVSDAEQTAALELSELLDGLPLALSQAGAYIRQTACGVAGYLDMYRKVGYKLLQKRGNVAPGDHPDPVTVTWKLSYQKLQRDNPAAIEVLRICAFLDADDIPEEIFVRGISVWAEIYRALPIWKKWRNALLGRFYWQWTDERRLVRLVGNDPQAFDIILESILHYSLLQRDSNQHILSMHRLVQEDIQSELTTRQKQEYAVRAVRLLVAVFPDGDVYTNVGDWPQCERLLASSLSMTTWVDELQLNVSEAALLLNQLGFYLNTVKANYAQALSLYEGSLVISESVYGKNHPEVAIRLNNLATLYYKQGNYDKALSLCECSLVIRENLLGENHPDVASSLNNLAALYKSQGDYDKALSSYQRSLAIREKVSGKNHPHVATSLNNLAEFYRNQSDYDKALPLYERSLAIREKVLGENHPDVATNLNNLAGLYSEQGDYDKALPLYERALTILRRVFDETHPYVQIVKENYESCLSKQDG